MKTAPFNLEKALAGKPCITRNGRKVLQIKKFEMDNSTKFVCYFGESDYSLYEENGKINIPWRNNKIEEVQNSDLFMLVEPQVYCIGIHPAEDIDLIGCPMITSALPKERFEKEFITWKFRKVLEFTLDEDES